MKQVFIKEYPDHTRDKFELLDILEYIQEAFNFGKRASRTRMDLHLNPPPALKSLFEWEASLNLDVLKYICGGESPIDYLDYGIIGSWGIKYEKEAGLVIHNHFPYTYTCAYYLNVFEDSAPLMVIPNGNKDKKDAEPVEIKEGYMYVIPGWWYHYVEDNRSLDRTAIISNWLPEAQENLKVSNFN